MSRIEFVRFPFEREGYPRARWQVGPRMDAKGLARMLAGRDREPPFDGCQCFVRARYAQFHALARIGVGPDQGVLLPAYHCRTMIEPVIRRGAEPVLFRVDTSLRADVEDVDRLLRRRPDIRCMVLPHYFGFAQPVSELMPVLERHGVALIEDCAHVMTPAPTPDGPGRRGVFSIFCPAKFLPCPDGGLLCATAGAPGTELPLVRRSAGRELRICLRMLEQVLRLSKRGPGPGQRGEQDPNRHESDATVERDSIDTETIRAGSSRDYIPEFEDTRCSVWSSRILQTADMGAVACARRRNYQHWLSELETLPGCAPLFGALDEHTVPYMFPLILEKPDCQFDALKRLGMPLFRWDELADSECSVSSRYRTALVHLPCHQNLDADMLAQLADILRQGLANAIDRKAVA